MAERSLLFMCVGCLCRSCAFPNLLLTPWKDQAYPKGCLSILLVVVEAEKILEKEKKQKKKKILVCITKLPKHMNYNVIEALLD